MSEQKYNLPGTVGGDRRRVPFYIAFDAQDETPLPVEIRKPNRNRRKVKNATRSNRRNRR